MEKGSGNANRDIAHAIRVIAGVDGLKNARFVTATVNEVQEAERTITCTTVLGASDVELTGVNLQSEPNDGFVLVPALDTDVLVCIMPDTSAYMVKCNDIDRIICVIDNQNSFIFDSNGFVWNDGLNGGLINIIDFTAKQNLMISQINTQLTAISTGISGAGGTYTPVPITTFNKSDYEDTKIKH